MGRKRSSARPASVKSATAKSAEVENFSHTTSSRKNIPPAKIAAEGKIPVVKKAKYGYSAHLSPELRFDTSGKSDRVSGIVEKAISGQKLTNEEAEILRIVAANVSQPWLEWSDKKEQHDRQWLEVDPVVLHIHERVSAKAIVRTAKRKDVQRILFADPEQEYGEAIQFYEHDIDWANRLILGDSLQVMSSLARREDLAGKVQMIYIDPPYGIKFASNFQPEVSQREVNDKDADLSREAEMVKAYRDTWHLGIHSYLSYLRDRILVARELLAETGSLFVQISDENIHRVRNILDEVLGAKNFLSQITFQKTTGATTLTLPTTSDFILWYCKDRNRVKFRKLFLMATPGEEGATEYKRVETAMGELHPISRFQNENGDLSLPVGARILATDSIVSKGGDDADVTFGHGSSAITLSCKPNRHWKPGVEGIKRLWKAGRLLHQPGLRIYRRYFDDFRARELTHVWTDTRGDDDPLYVVQTSPKVIERCMLMTTDPADIVLDPTCGSGTTAYVAEQWGRRWVTIDTSRVAIAIARQRLLTAKFGRYRVKGENPSEVEGRNNVGIDPSSNFVYETVPHVMLGEIANNENLDPIFAKHDQILDEKLAALNSALAKVSDDLRVTLAQKLAAKMQHDGLRAATDADRRRWLLPSTTKAHIETAFAGKKKLKSTHVKKHAEQVPPDGVFAHWHVPFDIDTDWPDEFSNAVTDYHHAWRAKMDAVRACIESNTEQESLVDKPEVISGVARVTGPFTVEGVRPEELSLDEEGQTFDPTPDEWQASGLDGDPAQNASAYLDRMRQLLSNDGVTFPNNEHRDFLRVDPLDVVDSALHAEAIWGSGNDDEPCNVGIAFGPQYGPVIAEQVEDLVRASRRYDELVIAGFSFDGTAQEVIQESANQRLKIHMAHIRPDVSPGMDGLLKDTPESQIFTVFGQPEVEVRPAKKGQNGELEVELLGVDIYSPLTGEIKSTGADKVAAWFLDSDYDGRCFCTTQAFFPDQNAWEKIAKALGSAADEEAFAAYKGTVSLPFSPGQHNRIAVKVIDPRGNEVMAIRSLKGGE